MLCRGQRPNPRRRLVRFSRRPSAAVLAPVIIRRRRSRPTPSTPTATAAAATAATRCPQSSTDIQVKPIGCVTQGSRPPLQRASLAFGSSVLCAAAAVAVAAERLPRPRPSPARRHPAPPRDSAACVWVCVACPSVRPSVRLTDRPSVQPAVRPAVQPQPGTCVCQDGHLPPPCV